MRDIVFSSTTQLAAAIRAGHVSAVEALEAHLAQIERHNPALNAVRLNKPKNERVKPMKRWLVVRYGGRYTGCPLH